MRSLMLVLFGVVLGIGSTLFWPTGSTPVELAGTATLVGAPGQEIQVSEVEVEVASSADPHKITEVSRGPVRDPFRRVSELTEDSTLGVTQAPSTYAPQDRDTQMMPLDTAESGWMRVGTYLNSTGSGDGGRRDLVTGWAPDLQSP